MLTNQDRRFGISVIIPCYNSGGELLTEAIDSVVQQPLSCGREIIVVDDGSDDPATLAAIDTMSYRPDVRVVRLPHNLGAQAARNAGLDAARFDYILPLDSDDRLATDPQLLTSGGYLEPAIRLLDSGDEVAFVHTYSRMFEGFDGFTISAYPLREELLVRKHHAPMPIVYRRADALAAGGYDRNIRKWQDWAFAIDLLAARHRRRTPNAIACIPGPHHEYRVHSRFPRLSTSSVSELDMTRYVVHKNLDYFRAVLDDDRGADELAAEVYASKPDRLTDLLHMAAADLHQALTVAGQRHAAIHSPADSLGIP
ncbi:glycosyltransferase family 2 protein [Nocardia amikacinitolerans]|uniref:glycosyltransferase family 2 protein n=1 Tax=Nocardia amikacinitolerans TaxID=756689 RepID=UPI0036ADB91A